MISYIDTEAATSRYTEVFDFYLEERVMPSDADPSDPLLRPIAAIADDYRTMMQGDPETGDAVKRAAAAVISDFVEQLAQIDREAQSELDMINRFERASIFDKRSMWGAVKATIERGYSTLEVNLPGYIKQFATEDRDAVFAALIGDWRAACQAKIDRLRRSLISKGEKQLRQAVGQLAQADITERTGLAAITRRYPIIEDIAHEIGRARLSPTQTYDSLIYRYLPSTLSRNNSGKEIDRIITGNEIERLLPAEFSLPDELFDRKWVDRQLQQFDSRDTRLPRRTAVKHPVPRLTRGPIIAAVDTSYSMHGQPMEIAFALIRRLASIAFREKRDCFLISFSVRTKTIDLTSPGNYGRLSDFLNEHYSGGTSGEQMLSRAIEALHTKKYEMADVLIVSDMQFYRPSDATLAAIRAEQTLGTRFHALQIGSAPQLYNDILDRIWKLNVN